MAAISGLDHVGIAVEDLDEAIETFSTLLGVPETGYRLDDGKEYDDDGNLVEEWSIAYLDTGNGVYLELIEPGEVGEGPLGRFVESQGEGLHHVSFWVSPREEFREFFETLSEMGFDTVDDEPRRSDPEAPHDNFFTYVHPKSAHSTLVEMITPYRIADGEMTPAETAEDAQK